MLCFLSRTVLSIFLFPPCYHLLLIPTVSFAENVYVQTEVKIIRYIIIIHRILLIAYLIPEIRFYYVIKNNERINVMSVFYVH